MIYRMQEGVFSLDGAWEDRTVTMLRPSGPAANGASIVVTRDILPAGASLAEHVARQRHSFQHELPRFTLLQDATGELDARPSHLLEFHWDNQGALLYQAVVIVLDGDRLLNFTASIPRQSADVATRRSLLQAIGSFRFGPRPDETAPDETAPEEPSPGETPA